MSGSGSGNRNGPSDTGSDASIVGSKTPSEITSATLASKPSSSSPSDSDEITTPPSAETSGSQSSASSSPSSAPSSSPSSAPSGSTGSVPTPRSGATLGSKGHVEGPASDLPSMGEIHPGSLPGSVAWQNDLNAQLERYARSSGVFAQPPLGPLPMRRGMPSPDRVPTGDTQGADDPDIGLPRSLNAIAAPSNGGAAERLVLDDSTQPDPDHLPDKSGKS